MKIHFLKVGNGDCSIVEHSDSITIMDVMNARFKDEDARDNHENPYTYLKRNVGNRSIIRYIQSHPDMDHLDGIHTIVPDNIINFWDTQHKRPKPEEFTRGYRELDWDFYVKKGADSLNFYRGTYKIVRGDYTEYEYNLYVISPSEENVKEANEKEEWNHLSYVVLFEQEGFKVLLGGDAKEEIWEDILEETKRNPTFKKLISNVGFFKASHHGRKTSYCGKEILDIINPSFIIISKGTIDPEDMAYSSYYQWVKDKYNNDKKRIYLTSEGNVICEFDFNNRLYKIEQ